MFAQLLFLFVVVPVVELYMLIRLGTLIGAMPTLGIVIITGIVGAALAKQQGFAVLRRIQTEMGSMQMPGDAMFDGVLVLIGGILLMTPGILTDIAGFLLLIPFSRDMLKFYIKNWVSRKIQSGEVVYYSNSRIDI